MSHGGIQRNQTISGLNIEESGYQQKRAPETNGNVDDHNFQISVLTAWRADGHLSIENVFAGDRKRRKVIIVSTEIKSRERELDIEMRMLDRIRNRNHNHDRN